MQLTTVANQNIWWQKIRYKKVANLAEETNQKVRIDSRVIVTLSKNFLGTLHTNMITLCTVSRGLRTGEFKPVN